MPTPQAQPGVKMQHREIRPLVSVWTSKAETHKWSYNLTVLL